MDSINLVRRFIVVLVLAIVVSACGGSPTGPGSTPPPPPPPTFGFVDLWYERPAGLTCRAEGTEFADYCTFPLAVTSNGKWPEGYNFSGLRMDRQPDGRYKVRVPAPAGTLEWSVLETWRCAPVNGCADAFTGIGLSVNGVRMVDRSFSTMFHFTPPDGVSPR
jgi:hypothetical protein